jgi:hypothetical protein
MGQEERDARVQKRCAVKVLRDNVSRDADIPIDIEAILQSIFAVHIKSEDNQAMIVFTVPRRQDRAVRHQSRARGS